MTQSGEDNTSSVHPSEGKEYGILGFIEGRPPHTVEQDDDRVSTYPHLVAREFLAFGLMFAALLLVSFLFASPLEELANPGKTPNPAKAPWYFLSLQELLHYSPPFIAGVVVPGLLVFTACAIPFFRGRMVLLPIGFLIATVAVPTVDGLIWNGIHTVAPDFADAIRVYGIPTFILLIVSALLLSKLVLSPMFDDEKRVERARRRWFVTFVLMLTVLVLIGVYFRGPEWKWVWPWQ
jgi:hypothetical protein